MCLCFEAFPSCFLLCPFPSFTRWVSSLVMIFFVLLPKMSFFIFKGHLIHLHLPAQLHLCPSSFLDLTPPRLRYSPILTLLVLVAVNFNTLLFSPFHLSCFPLAVSPCLGVLLQTVAEEEAAALCKDGNTENKVKKRLHAAGVILRSLSFKAWKL